MRTITGAVPPDWTLARAAERMEFLGVRELPVVDEAGRVIGIVCRSDFLPHRGHFEWTAVADAMSTDVVVTSPTAPGPAVAKLLLDHHINAVPVVADGGRLVGIVNRSDLLLPLADVTVARRGRRSDGDGP